MEPNLSLYEDALQFYLVITSDDGQLSDDMQFAREVFSFDFFFFIFCSFLSPLWHSYENTFVTILFPET